METTGRVIASFEPRAWATVKKRLRRIAGVRVAHIDDYRSSPSKAHRDPAVAVSELGLAVIDPRRADTDEPALRKAGVTVRPEHVLTRARVAKGATAPPTTRLDWLIESDQTWALRALGVGLNDTEGSGITVGVIDTGIAEHRDLAAVAERVSLVPGHDGGDDIGHGTHCAGLIGGQRRPASGPRYGIAPGARVIGLRVFGGDESAGEGTIRTAIYLAVRTYRCRVLSLAAGRLAPTYTKEDEYLGQFLVAENCILMAAAGNDSDRNGGVARPTRAPANAPFVPAIGAMTATLQVWNDSNGVGNDPATRVDAIAPGTNIRSAWIRGTQSVSGTSAATAIAAGVAAAVWSRDPSLAAPEVVRMLTRSAQRIPDAPTGAAGAGYLQVRRYGT